MKKSSHKYLFLNRIPLWSQLLVLLTLFFSMLVSFLLVRDYQKNRQYIIRQRIDTANRVLELEVNNLEQYIRDLALFCVQPLYDSRFQGIIASRTPLSSSQRTYLREQIKSYYFSRTDLEGYEMYLCYQQEAYGRYGKSQHVTLLTDSSLPQDKGFTLSSSGRYYNAVMPSENPDNFFSYYQSIIRIKTCEPEAVVRLEISKSYADSLNGAHLAGNEFICVLNQEGDLLFSGDPALSSETPEALDVVRNCQSGDSLSLTLKGEPHLGVVYRGEKYGLSLAAFLPYSVINNEISAILRSSIMFAIVIWALTGFFTYLILRFTMRPLSVLSSQMHQAGEGNFSPVTTSGRSREIENLTVSYNDMVSRIDHLIRQNYLSEINEKTSRLTALEAQLNPHFLYNTLQAIGTEALLNDQPQINEMVTSLASNLRYSIKGGDLVPLESEMTYVKNYILLQKIRLEDRLSITIDVDESYYKIPVPKISIQTLVENSIIHGMGPDSDSISIHIRAALQDDMFTVTVSDDGCGIEPGQLAQMQKDFQQFLKPGTAGKIGLANLYSRLQLLYHTQAELLISSRPGNGTSITLKLPFKDTERQVEKYV